MSFHNCFQGTIFVFNFRINREDVFYFFSFKILNERCKSNLKYLGHFQAQLACSPPLGPRQTNWLRWLCTTVSVQGLICNTKLTDNQHYYSLSYFKKTLVSSLLEFLVSLIMQIFPNLQWKRRQTWLFECCLVLVLSVYLHHLVSKGPSVCFSTLMVQQFQGDTRHKYQTQG